MISASTLGKTSWAKGTKGKLSLFSSKMELLLFCRAGFVVFSPNAPALFSHAIDLARKVDLG